MRKQYLTLAVFAFILSAAPIICAGDDGKTILPPDESTTTTEAAPQFRISAEYDVEETYVGESEVSRGRHVVSDFDESDTLVSFVLTPRVSFGVLRLGAAYERFQFGFDNGTELADTLQEANLVIGLDTQFSDSILVRFEADPGFYGAGMGDLETNDLNVPFIVGGTYIYSPDLQFVLGVGVDVNRKYPVVPGGGIRWKFANQWVMNAVLPTPRLEYDWTPQFTLYGGATLKDETFRMSDNFGFGTRTDLRRAVFNYTEIRAGAGFDWKLAPALTLSAEVGYVPYREFDFYRTDVRYHQDNGAPYGSLSLHGAF